MQRKARDWLPLDEIVAALPETDERRFCCPPDPSGVFAQPKSRLVSIPAEPYLVVAPVESPRLILKDVFAGTEELRFWRPPDLGWITGKNDLVVEWSMHELQCLPDVGDALAGTDAPGFRIPPDGVDGVSGGVSDCCC